MDNSSKAIEFSLKIQKYRDFKLNIWYVDTVVNRMEILEDVLNKITKMSEDNVKNNIKIHKTLQKYYFFVTFCIYM